MLNRNRSFIEDLFFEQETEILASNYKHGLIRSLVIIIHSLLFSRIESSTIINIPDHSVIAVVFFPNEFAAVNQSNAPILQNSQIIYLHNHHLSIIRATLGWRGLISSLTRFMKIVLREKGWRYIRRMTYPLFGWLLYDTFTKILSGRSDLRIVTTNMQHPLSIAIARAAFDTGQASIFHEHSTTPRLVLYDRGYHSYYVQSTHTGSMLVEYGINAKYIHILRHNSMSYNPRISCPIQNVGVCINILDSLQAIEQITKAIRAQGLHPIYRIHDADLRINNLQKIANKEGIEISYARDSRIESFLQTIDLVVVGNSNVVADAIIAGRHIIYYWSGSKQLFDYYGLINYYEIPYADEPELLVKKLKNLLDSTNDKS